MALYSELLTGFLRDVELRRLIPAQRALRSDLGPLDELMASIEEKGVLQPLIVRPHGNRFEVVAGNRRLEACRKLRLNRIPCHVIELDDKEAYEVSLVENLHHRTLDVIEEAQAFKRYVDEHGYGGISELAKRIGKSPTYVSRRIALLQLPVGVKEELLRRRKASTIAEELVALNEDQRQQVTELIDWDRVTRREVRRIIRDVKEEGDREPSEQSYYPQRDKKTRYLSRILARLIASLRITLMRFDEALDHVNDSDWLVKEPLVDHRLLLHTHIDNLLKLRRRVQHHMMPAL